ncbi:hypothetical protein NLG97_g311 [Lecanicillium saksenae]|uniref:Uncharacterized protein n=1 Tax=Lecanicillium saksenae TaxID=468837 RepID=A0ACC1R6X3_9HYPO|nr:hypothetical protein NLG97_g311 [Lecanicillium saksenae]
MTNSQARSQTEMEHTPCELTAQGSTCSESITHKDAMTENKLPQAPQIDPPPNGGARAWLQVLAAYFLFFNTWGMINAFGAFQTYYNTALPRSASDIAWVGTLQGFLLMFMSGVTGPLFDRGYSRPLLITGTLAMSFGLMMTSLSNEYYQVFLAQGLVTGIGAGLLSVPGLAIISQYFSSKRGLATGIVASGGSVGALLFPIIFSRLQIQISFGWATRIIGFLVLSTLAMSTVLLRPRHPPAAKVRAMVDVSAFHSPEFLGITLAMFLYLMGLYVPVFYIGLYAEQVLNVDKAFSFYLLSILNATSIVGRAIVGPITDKIGALNMMIPIAASTGILQFAWISISSTAGVIIFCIFYGFFSGAYVTLLGALLAGMAPQVNKVGTWMGMNFCISSFGLLIGNPIAGALLQHGGFTSLQIFGGTMVFAGCLGFCLVRYIKLRKGVAWNMKA